MTCPATGSGDNKWTFPLPWIKQPGMVSHGIDGRTRIAITDHTPAMNLVAWVLPEDADHFIALTAQLADALRERDEAQAALREAREGMQAALKGLPDKPSDAEVILKSYLEVGP